MFLHPIIALANAECSKGQQPKHSSIAGQKIMREHRNVSLALFLPFLICTFDCKNNLSYNIGRNQKEV